MFKNCDISTDFGMDSPISLNSIDDSKQFCTFSVGDPRVKSISIARVKVPILKIDLKALVVRDEIKVTSVNYKSIKRNENYSKTNKNTKKNNTGGYSVIREAKNNVSVARKPLRDRNSAKPISSAATKVVTYKSLSPFQHTLVSKTVKNQ